MLSGCISIYWGAENVLNYISSKCFIDRRNFKDEQSLYDFFKSINAITFNTYQEKIAAFIDSQSAKKFYIEIMLKKGQLKVKSETMLNSLYNWVLLRIKC